MCYPARPVLSSPKSKTLFISFFTSTRMSSSASPTKPPLCCTLWSPGLPLYCHWYTDCWLENCWLLLLRPMFWELHTLMCSWLNHWSWSLAVNTVPCRWLWQRRWVLEIALQSLFSRIGRRQCSPEWWRWMSNIFLFFKHSLPQVWSPLQTTLTTTQTIWRRPTPSKWRRDW